MEPDSQETVWAGSLPERIGPYRVLRKLGEGGMGVVYEAEQDHPRRTVALKLMRTAALTGAAVRRFDLEVEVLGRLEHPGIARIYDAGAARVGGVEQPYFAMELVDGLEITRYAEARGLGLRDRLELMARVCDAVQYAHQKGVIHRDLKPANILVPVAGATAAAAGATTGAGAALAVQPKVLDFGVARATDADLQATTLRTSVGELVGTLPYMSPEQVAGDVFEMDARSDVYSLGVVLYELLSGRLPHEELRTRPLEALRIVGETDPVRLGALVPACRGDVETIVARALAREKERRYDSAAQLAEDLRRHLRDEPILARPATTIYQLRKLARRHRPLVVGAVLALVGLVLGTALAARQAAVATRQRDRALVAERQATEVNRFLTDMLATADPWESPDREVTVVEVLDAAAATLGGRFAAEPEVETAVRGALGRSYESLGRTDEAAEQLARVLELSRGLHGEADVQTFNAASYLALVRQEQGETAAAESLATWARDGFAAHAPDHLDALSAANNLAVVYTGQGRYEEAADLLRDAVARSRRARGDEDEETLRYMANLGSVLTHLGRGDEAAPYYAASLAGREALHGDRHPSVLQARNDLAMLDVDLGRLAEAESLLVVTVAEAPAVLGPDHPMVYTFKNNLAGILQHAERHDEALPLLEEAYRFNRRVRGPRHASTFVAANNLAGSLEGLGRYAEAESLYVATLAGRREVLGPDHPATIGSLNNLGFLYRTEGRRAEAEPLFREAWDRFRVALGEKHPSTLVAASNLGNLYNEMERFAEAAPINAEVLAGLREALPPDHWLLGTVLVRRGVSLSGLGRHDEAEPLLLQGYGVLSESLGPASDRARTAARALADFYERSGRPAEAAAWSARSEGG